MDFGNNQKDHIRIKISNIYLLCGSLRSLLRVGIYYLLKQTEIMKTEFMTTETFQFKHDSMGREIVNTARIFFDDNGEVHSVNFNGPVRRFTSEQWNQLLFEIKNRENKPKTLTINSNEQPGVPFLPSVIPAHKMNFAQAVKFVFSGGGGMAGVMDRLEKIGKAAEGEMSEKEKTASQGLLKNLKELMDNGKSGSDSGRNIG